jgi:hypothetical protein
MQHFRLIHEGPGIIFGGHPSPVCDRTNSGFELSSQTDLEFPSKDKSIANKSCISIEAHKKDFSDNDNERAIVDSEVKDRKIRKISRVVVEDYQHGAGNVADLARPHGVGKSEHV